VVRSVVSSSLIVLGIGCLVVATIKNGWHWFWDGPAMARAPVGMVLLIVAAVLDPSLR
jgi:hypothetical protein